MKPRKLRKSPDIAPSPFDVPKGRANPSARPVNSITHGQHLILMLIYRYENRIVAGRGLEQWEVRSILIELFGEEGFSQPTVRQMINSLEDRKYLHVRRDTFAGGATKLRYVMAEKGIEMLEEIAKDTLVVVNSSVEYKKGE